MRNNSDVIWSLLLSTPPTHAARLMHPHKRVYEDGGVEPALHAPLADFVRSPSSCCARCRWSAAAGSPAASDKKHRTWADEVEDEDGASVLSSDGSSCLWLLRV